MASYLVSLGNISHPPDVTASQNISIATSPQKTLQQDKEVVRRSGNYKPPICDNDFIQSLSSPYGEARFRKRAEYLKEYVRSLLEKKEDASESMELVDTLQRLGLSYLFENEIKTVLQNKHIDKTKENDLHFTALKFRILRQHGFFIPQDEFASFLDESGVFKEALGNDTRAILSLYDASYTSLEGETLLDDAREFATRHLRQALIKRNLSSELRKLVERGLEFPYYWRTPRLEARWSIARYERKEKKDAQLLELSKLDYNICQAGHQTNIKAMSRWWTEKGLAQVLPFSRDRLPESFLWSLGHVFDSKYSRATQWLTLVYQFVTTVDDIYDVYGTLEELELFTKAVERWDIDALDELPNIYMRLFYLALINFNNEMGFTTMKLQGWNIVPLLKKFWIDLCNAYLVEAKWFHEGYTPSFEEYKNNAWISIGGTLVLSTLFLLMDPEITEERLILLNNYQDIIRPTALAGRLQDDLGTSNKELERGDVPKAVQCYLHEKGVSEEAAKQHVKHMISESWKKMNRYMVLGSSFPRDFVKSSMDALRVVQWFYRDGDGFGFQRERAFDLFNRLVVQPIPLVDEQDQLGLCTLSVIKEFINFCTNVGNI